MKTFDWQSYFDFLSEHMRNSEIDKFVQAFQASNRMAEIMSNYMQKYHFSDYFNTVMAIQESVQRISGIQSAFANSFYSAMRLSSEISKMSPATREALFIGISEIAAIQPAYHNLSEMILNAASVIERAAQYIPETNQQEVEQIKEEIPEVQTSHDNGITLDRILAIINILLVIYGAILQSLPNEQLDRLAAQNDVIISQQAELIELNQEDQELYEVLTDLKDSINSLADEVDALRDEIEDLNDLPDSPDTSEIEEPQEQDADAEKQDGDL